MRKRELFVRKYGPEAGGKLYHALQSQAAHAGVSARLRRKLDALTRGEPWPPARPRDEVLPLFPDDAPTVNARSEVEAGELVGSVA